MLARMTSRELTEWMAFYSLEPFGGDTPYIGHAITAATVYNVNHDKDNQMKVDNFMPKWNHQEAEQTPEQMIQFAAMFTEALGGTIALKDKGDNG
jgi:hypothetical protein